MSSHFNVGDKVVAKLWPELGTGEVLSLTKDQNSIAARVAEVHWPDANQTSNHSFVALKPADQAATA